MKRLLLLAAILWFSVANAQVHKTAIFIGNSYTYANDLPGMIKSIAISKGNDFSHTSSTPGGAAFSSHSFSETSLRLIDSTEYDYMILQEQSVTLADTENGFSKYFHRSYRFADVLNHKSKLADTCHKTLFYLTWGRKEGNGIYQSPAYYGADYNGMQDNLTINYSQLAEYLDAQISPVGEAWRIIVNQHPEIEMYTPDGSHPSEAGTYLAACVFYMSIFQDDIDDIWKPSGLQDSTAQKLRNAAFQVLNDNWERWNIDLNAPTCSSAGLVNNIAAWDSTELQRVSYLEEIRFTDNLHGYVRGTGFAIWQTDDAGDSWEKVEPPAFIETDWDEEHSFDVFFTNKDTAWYTVGGDEVDSSTMVFTGIFGFKAEFNAYARIYRTTDGGASWEERSPDRTTYQILDSALLSDRPKFTNMHIHFDDGLRGTMVCSFENKDSLIHTFWTNDGGLSWNLNLDTVQKTSSQLWFKNASTAFKSGYKDTVNELNDPQILYKTTDYGASWEELAHLPVPCCKVPFYNIIHSLSALSQVGEDTLSTISTLYGPTLFRSVNGGLDWDSITKINVPANVSDILRLEDGTYLLSTDGNFGRLMISYDEGKTWYLETSFENTIKSITATSDYIYVGDGRGTIHRKETISIGRPERTTSFDFQLFPNPSRDLVYIQDAPANSVVKVYNVNGALVQELNTNALGSVTLFTEKIRAGYYFVNIDFPQGTIQKKLIIGSNN